MAYNWVHAATQNQTARLGDRLVLFVLAECADVATGTCYPSVETIAERTLLSERATHYCLKRLVGLGLITIRTNASEYGTNIYTLSQSMMGGANFAPGGVQSTTQNMSDFAPKPSVKPSEKNIYSARTKITDEWEPSEAGIKYAKSKGMSDPTDEIRKFINHHIEPHKPIIDYDRGWTTWCINFANWNKPKSTTAPPKHTGRKMTDAEKIGFIG